MKSTTYLLVGALVAVAIIAIIKKHFFEVADYDLLTQGNALRFAIEGYEDAEASETAVASEDEEADPDAEEVEGYESEDDDYDDVEHMTTAAKAKRGAKKAKAKLRAAAKKLKAKKAKAQAHAVAAPAAATAAPAAATAAKPTATAPEKFENTSRFQELKGKWDAYKAGSGPALADEERTELLVLLEAPPDEQDEQADVETEEFEQMPYQGTEYAMF